mmetsp:Transcript_8390/g.14411  ORF Transcript_8390/g.14411 Transcript_8390/m.14411 type:complete len:387 (+) Transcript_8390:749-1909(+)
MCKSRRPGNPSAAGVRVVCVVRGAAGVGGVLGVFDSSCCGGVAAGELGDEAQDVLVLAALLQRPRYPKHRRHPLPTGGVVLVRGGVLGEELVERRLGVNYAGLVEVRDDELTVEGRVGGDAAVLHVLADGEGHPELVVAVGDEGGEDVGVALRVPVHALARQDAVEAPHLLLLHPLEARHPPHEHRHANGPQQRRHVAEVVRVLLDSGEELGEALAFGALEALGRAQLQAPHPALLRLLQHHRLCLPSLVRVRGSNVVVWWQLVARLLCLLVAFVVVVALDGLADVAPAVPEAVGEGAHHAGDLVGGDGEDVAALVPQHVRVVLVQPRLLPHTHVHRRLPLSPLRKRLFRDLGAGLRLLRRLGRLFGSARSGCGHGGLKRGITQRA